MQSCIRLQNFLHFSHVTRSHFSFRYTNFTSLTFPQRPRQQGSGILILQAYSKRGKETGRSRNVHPLVPEGSTKTYGILTSHVAWRQPQQNKGGWRRITRRPQEETKAAFKGGQARPWWTHAGRGHTPAQALTVQRAGRPWQPAPPYAYVHGSRPTLPTRHGQRQRILGYASCGFSGTLSAFSSFRPLSSPAPALAPPRAGRSSPWTRCSAPPGASRRRPPSPSSPRSRCRTMSHLKCKQFLVIRTRGKG